MAIGKTNAFATVTAPKVDFGEVALNAQKFQQEADEKRLAKAAAKPKEKEVKPLEVRAQTTGHIKFDVLQTEKLASKQTEYYNRISAGDIAGANLVEQQAYMLVSQMGKAKESFKAYNEALEKKEISKASLAFTEAFNSIINGNYDVKDVDGETVFIPYKTRSDGRLEVGGDGNPILVNVTNSFGESKPYVTLNEVVNWKASVIPSTSLVGEDGKGLVQNIASSVGVYQRKREDGSITIDKTFLDNEDSETLKKTAREVLMSSNALFADVANQLLPNDDRFRNPKKEYTKEDYDDVSNALYEKVKQVYKLKDVKAEDEARGFSSRNAANKIPFVDPLSPVTINTKIAIQEAGKKEPSMVSKKATIWTISGEKGEFSDRVATGLGFIPSSGEAIFQYRQKSSDSLGTSTGPASSKLGQSSIGGKTEVLSGDNAVAFIQQLRGVKYLDVDDKEKTFESVLDIGNYIYKKAIEQNISNDVKIKMRNYFNRELGLIFDTNTNSFRTKKANEK